jgi:hypothetical protein
VLQHGTQVLQIEKQHAVVVGDFEDEIQYAGLRLIEIKQS